MVTRNQIAKFFQDFVAAHYQLKGYGYGDFWEISQSESAIYPLMWVSPQPVPIDGMQVEHTYVIAMADRVLGGESNELEVESDTFQYCQDLIAALNDQSENDWELQESFTATPFTEKWKDDVAGFLLTLTLSTDFNHDACAIPSSGVPSDTSPACLPAGLRVNGVAFTNIGSGQTFNLVVKYNDGSVAPGTQVGNEYHVPSSGTCADAVAALRNSLGTLLSSTSIASGATQNISAPDATAVLKNSANTTIKSEAIPSGVSENIQVDDVTWTDSDLTPRSTVYGLPIVCSPGQSPSGVSLQWPNGHVYASYRPGDEGSILQAGYFNYSRPQYPAATPELDYSLGQTYFWQLKAALKVGTVSSKIRFVDVRGGQNFGATNNINKIVIDKLSGIGFYRVPSDLGAIKTWNNAVDDALTFSVVVDGVTFNQFHLITLEELNILTGQSWSQIGNGTLQDPITGILLLLSSANDEFWTSTTSTNNTANAYTKGWNPPPYMRIISKSATFGLSFYAFDARNLITAP